MIADVLVVIGLVVVCGVLGLYLWWTEGGRR